ncbi:MAG: sensor histidine kinase [Propionicimonas sp.]|uniref:sensor histidine kinase n=1 Tax=Propionicimonas sp. TaxID=1955623 RepID=UPI002B2207BD|nr:sensor histidine kinase [Propionicimonas sp.]MEA4943955.1 sensor histidine kinase [Propionicimonas sp.]MEA5052724.1 sensor histidine kinase [Propionicimonas sp.]MEA5119345.1 sensor histidine kinase [Propionicimonas sp.]
MDVRELLFPAGATKHDWALDAALATGLALLTVPPYWGSGPHGTQVMLSSLLMVLPMVLRRHSPLLTLALISVGALLQLVYASLPLPSLVVIPIVAYSVARWVPGHVARVVLVVGAVGAVLGPARWVIGDLSRTSLNQVVWFVLAWFVCIGLVVTPYAIGRRVREEFTAHAHLVATAEERYRSLITEREQQARLAESRARNQIARELHDIVAHSLSVIIVQAEGGRAMAAKKPEAAIAALDTIAETGRESLTEMRRILGVLRADPGQSEADFAPAPRLTDIPDLVARTSDRFQLSVNGQPPRVSAAMELTVYRVVQEALTNVLKHAGPAALAWVTLTYAPTEIIVDVLDNGVPDATQTAQPGHGLRGMNERVTSMGGRMVARPRPSGGFQLTVVLPLVPYRPASTH